MIHRLTSSLCSFCVIAALPLQATILHDWDFSTLPNDATFSSVADTGTVGGISWLNSTGQEDNYSNSGVLDGVYRISRSTSGATSLYADIADLTVDSQPVWAVIDIAGWNLSSASNQIIRLDLTTTASNTTVAGQIRMDRAALNDAGLETVTWTGQALGTGSSNAPGSLLLSANFSGPLSIALMFDKANGSYEVSYLLPGGTEFISLGTGDIASDRNGAALRLNLNGSFNAEGEYLDISRIYITDVAPIPEPSTYALLAAGCCVAIAALRRRRSPF